MDSPYDIFVRKYENPAEPLTVVTVTALMTVNDLRQTLLQKLPQLKSVARI